MQIYNKQYQWQKKDWIMGGQEESTLLPLPPQPPLHLQLLRRRRTQRLNQPDARVCRFPLMPRPELRFTLRPVQNPVVRFLGADGFLARAAVTVFAVRGAVDVDALVEADAGFWCTAGSGG